ncbi:MAG: M23 family metallopeptidase [Saprospiraceae bacterium]|nr:M23 family metallopeptidase [Saprospiraceae bacterium]|tara:strand:+ start:4717 stop:5448 length:732 start_codon:yes stop_codon:yes gene_type:complete
MNHSSEVIKQVRELLIISGVSEGEALEEMVDHYLCDIESQIGQNISPQIAIRKTLQNIARTDYSYQANAKRTNRSLLVAIMGLMLLSFMVYKVAIETKDNAPIEFVQNIPVLHGWPLEEAFTQISSKFGIRQHPILMSSVLHKGVDIKAKIGTSVLATGDGVIKETGFTEKAGKYIIVEHNARFSSRFNHLASVDVSVNDRVFKGSMIGKVGNSGMSTAPHLHFEIMDDNQHVDPLTYLMPNL